MVALAQELAGEGLDGNSYLLCSSLPLESHSQVHATGGN